MSRKRPLPHQSTRSPPNILKRRSEDQDAHGIDLSPVAIINSDHKDQPHSSSSHDVKRPCLHNQYHPGLTIDPLPSSVRSDQLTCQSLVAQRRKNPLPPLSWGDEDVVWTVMVEKDTMHSRGKPIVENHPALHARMRSILLDWLIEVCEVYRLHRDSYYKALDFTDRYLAAQLDLPKQQLQLIGITALFISTKIEEIYPPKLKEFAYVTDGACTETEILDLEFIMLKILNWNLNPHTANHWLTTYMQLLSKEDEVISDGDDAIATPSISGQMFLEVAQLMDLCMLDEDCHLFPYRVIAAGAIYHMMSPEQSLLVSGLSMEELAECVEWQVPFYRAVCDSMVPSELLKNTVAQIRSDEVHMYQTHTISLDLLDKAQTYQQQLADEEEQLPPTPPISTEKSRRDAETC